MASTPKRRKRAGKKGNSFVQQKMLSAENPSEATVKRVTSNDDVENWLKKVEMASDAAVQQTFCYGDAVRNKVREEDDTYAEAQQLLSQWVQDKMILDSDDEESTGYPGNNHDDPWQQRALEMDVKREWDHLLEDNYEAAGLNYLSNSKKKSARKKDPYDNLYDMDEGAAVDLVMKNMLEKQVVKEDCIKDLGLEPKKERDPRLKMDLRQQQVKENREKRDNDLQRHHRERQAKKEAHAQAKLILLKEERQKTLYAKHEEETIQKDMTRLRKEMEGERRQKEIFKYREKQEEESMKRLAEEDLEHLRMVQEAKFEEKRQDDEKKRQFLIKVEAFQNKQVARNMRVLQSHFSAWYKLVLQRRMQMGKARAIADWRCLFRAWNAWKSWVRESRIDKEALEHEYSVKEMFRKRKKAENHYKEIVLRKYFNIWQHWVQHEHIRKSLKDAQEQTRNKMAAFLEAAATGKLWAETHEIEHDSKHQEVDKMFEQSPRKQTHQRRDITSARSDQTDNSTSTHHHKYNTAPNTLPIEPWQITRNHLRLTPDQIASLGSHRDQSSVNPGRSDRDVNSDQSAFRSSSQLSDADNISQSATDRKVRKRFGAQPWMKTEQSYSGSNFGHRYSAQQKILKEQQKQLKDQQRMIEDLHFQQTQQTFKEQLQNQQSLLVELQQTQKTLQEHRTELFDSGNAGLGVPGDKAQQSVVAKNKMKGPGIEHEKTDSDKLSTTSGVSSAPSTARLSEPPCSSRTTDTSQTTSATQSNNKYIHMLNRMESRTAERARMKAEREERRRILEDQRLEELRAEEEERLRQELEDKKVRAEVHREQKRLEKQKEIDKHECMERMKYLNSLAEQHYEKSVAKFRGWVPWRRLVEMGRENRRRAVEYRRITLIRTVFHHWQKETWKILEEKNRRADELCNTLLVQGAFRQWKSYKHHMVIQEQRADNFYNRRLFSRVVNAWANWVTDERIASWDRENIATEHYQRLIILRPFRAWRKYPEFKKQEVERIKHKDEMRRKVLSILPDFEGLTVDKSMDNLSFL